MGLAILRGFDVQSTTAAVRSLLPNWRPSKSASSAALNVSLIQLLKKGLPGYPLKKNVRLKEFPAKIDALLAHNLAILLEKDLTTQAKAKKIKKRLDSFRGWEGVVLVILAGKVKDECRESLDDWVNQANNDREFMSAKEIVVARAPLA